jgi:hypothetical protein
MCNTTTTTKKNNNPFWRSNPMRTLKLSATIKSEMLEIQYYRWMAGHISQLFFCCFWAWEFSSPKATECPLDLPWFTYSKSWTKLKLCNKVMLGNMCLVTYTYDESYAW